MTTPHFCVGRRLKLDVRICYSRIPNAEQSDRVDLASMDRFRQRNRVGFAVLRHYRSSAMRSGLRYLVGKRPRHFPAASEHTRNLSLVEQLYEEVFYRGSVVGGLRGIRARTGRSRFAHRLQDLR